MKKDYSRIINLIITITLYVLVLIYKDTNYKDLLLGGLFAYGLATLTNWLSWCIEQRGILWTLAKALFVNDLRLSCSYLYKIKVNDHYLLVKSRKHGKFQPVGGNFKRGSYSSSFLNNLEVKPDDKFTNGNRSKDDLRLYIKGYKLGRFLKWYNQPNKEREVSYDREFYEELVETGILPRDLFPYPIINFRKQVVSKVRYSPYLKCKEVHIYDIVELAPTDEQLKYFEEMQNNKENTEYKWVTINQIKKQGYSDEKQSTQFEITDHSSEILI